MTEFDEMTELIDTVEVGKDGRMLIPSAIRKAMGIPGGGPVRLVLDETGLHVQTFRQALRVAQELVRKYIPADRDLVAELIAERRAEAKREMEEYG